MSQISEAVAAQYNRYPYPPQDEGWDRTEAGDPLVHSPLLWPEGRPRKELNILIAGCGTYQAARFARRNPASRVLGIDFSESSIAYQSALKERYGLKNLDLRLFDLKRVHELNESFDLIVSTGVLHHLDDPEEGLRSLSSALTESGVMVLMLYASGRRAGVYLLQDAFRRLGVNQDAAGLSFVRGVVGDLPEHHFFKWYERAAQELKTDAALVDTLLHPQDRAYSVPQILEFLESNGLHFQSWLDNFFYHPDGVFNPNSDLYRRTMQLPLREQWAVVDNLSLILGRHAFIATRRDPSLYTIDFSGVDWPTYIPIKSPGLTMKANGPGQVPRRLARAGTQGELSIASAMMLDAVDGRKRIADIIETVRWPGCAPETLRETVREFFARMWRLGHVMISKAPLR
jgi:SAM-dependent methyltransferase